MLRTRTRIQGGGIVVPLPKDETFRVEEGQEYSVNYEEDGRIVLVPVVEEETPPPAN